MTATDAFGALAAAMGVAMGASPLIQAVRVHRQGRSSDVSLTFLLILVAGGMCWLIYGILLGNAALTVANTVGVASSSITACVVVWWRRHPRDRDLDEGPAGPTPSVSPVREEVPAGYTPSVSPVREEVPAGYAPSVKPVRANAGSG